MPFSGSGTGIQNADDVFFSSVSDGDTLVYDSGTAKWNNGAVGGSSGTAIGVSVTEHGAVGDGSTDDTAAINAAIAAAGVGGTVLFPKTSGPYMVSSSLKPLSKQTWLGGHTPLFWGLEYDLDFRGDGGAIRATSGFTGSALIHNTSTGYRAKGVRLEKLLLLGNGESGSLHGIDFGPDSSGETTWRIHSCQLHAFGGAAFTGHAWVLDVRDTLFGRCGYGWAPSQGASGTACTAYDVRMIGCNFYFIYHDGILFNSTAKAGAVTLIGNRVERCGTTQGNVHVNRDENAVGIKLVKANNIQLIGNYTDANAKHGLEVDAAAVGDVVHIISAGNMWNRDGTGDNATTSLPGVRIYQGKYINFDGDQISYGKPNDDGGPGYTSPQWGVEFDSTVFCSWNGVVELAASTVAQAFKISETTTANWRLRLSENRTRSSIATMTNADAPVNPQKGEVFFNETANAMQIWDGSAWRTVTVT